MSVETSKKPEVQNEEKEEATLESPIKAVKSPKDVKEKESKKEVKKEAKEEPKQEAKETKEEAKEPVQTEIKEQEKQLNES